MARTHVIFILKGSGVRICQCLYNNSCYLMDIKKLQPCIQYMDSKVPYSFDRGAFIKQWHGINTLLISVLYIVYDWWCSQVYGEWTDPCSLMQWELYANKGSDLLCGFIYVKLCVTLVSLCVWEGGHINNKMKGQSEIAYLPKLANMMLIVMVIVITEILYIILIFDCFENQ